MSICNESLALVEWWRPHGMTEGKRAYRRLRRRDRTFRRSGISESPLKRIRE